MRGLIHRIALLLQVLLPAACAASSPLAKVTCGSSLKLGHVATKHRLHSLDLVYGRGSRQQFVTAYPQSDDALSYWTLHGAPGAPCAPGSAVSKGQRVRLQHAASRKWLHSHEVMSPMSGNQEVSAYGGEHQSDGGDVWEVAWDGAEPHWVQDVRVTLKHIDTGSFLHAFREARLGHPLTGQLEVCGVDKPDGTGSRWFAAEGVYLPVMEPAKGAAKRNGSDGGAREEL